MSKNITIDNGLSFELSENSLTAKVSISPKAKGDLIIPNFVEYNMRKYIVVSIKEDSFTGNQNIKSITLPENSSIKSIERQAFSNSSIESINIPTKCEELDEGCFLDTPKLTKISISPQNKAYKYLDTSHKLIQKNKGNFNVLFFTFKDIKNVFIPPTITEIGPFSFYKCEKLKKVEFSNEHTLRKIDSCAFLSSSLEQITIPKCVIEISDYSFSDCSNLHSIDFENNSNLTFVGQCAFSKSSFEYFCVPKNVKKIGKCAFSTCSLLKSVEFLSDDLMCGKFCFYLCENLLVVSFPNSKKVPIQINAYDRVSKDFLLFVCADSKLII